MPTTFKDVYVFEQKQNGNILVGAGGKCARATQAFSDHGNKIDAEFAARDLAYRAWREEWGPISWVDSIVTAHVIFLDHHVIYELRVEN